MDPAWESTRIVEQMALETPLTVANSLHKTVRKRLAWKLSAQVLGHSYPLRKELNEENADWYIKYYSCADPLHSTN